MMSGSKAPTLDAYGLFRATHFTIRPFRISWDYHPTFLCSYPRVGHKVFHPYEQAHVFLDL